MAAEVIFARNMKDAFGDAERSADALEHVIAQEADVVMLSEAYAEQAHESDLVMNAVSKMQYEGYQVLPHLYDDTDDRRDRHGWIDSGCKG
jgi:hypothetical protein